MSVRLTEYLSEVGQSKAANNPAWKVLVKEGRNLPNSVAEDIGGFSLMPSYSEKTLRRINKKQKFKNRLLSRAAKNEWRLTLPW